MTRLIIFLFFLKKKNKRGNLAMIKPTRAGNVRQKLVFVWPYSLSWMARGPAPIWLTLVETCWHFTSGVYDPLLSQTLTTEVKRQKSFPAKVDQAPIRRSPPMCRTKYINLWVKVSGFVKYYKFSIMIINKPDESLHWLTLFVIVLFSVLVSQEHSYILWCFYKERTQGHGGSIMGE